MINRGRKQGLTDKRWLSLRSYILARDSYLDQEAKRFGKRIEATEVHHIFPREYFPQWTYEEWNLISLSLSTHNKMHDRESHKLTKAGYELMTRTARKRGITLTDTVRTLVCANRDE